MFPHVSEPGFRFFFFFFLADYLLVFEAQNPPASIPAELRLRFPGCGSIGQRKQHL